MRFEDEEFKQQIFCSRRRESYPIDVATKRYTCGVISGPMAQSHNLSFEKMHCWRDIQAQHQLRNKNGMNEIAIQYAWISEEAMEQLVDDVQGKVYFRQSEA
jgi:hypothetical protein